MIPTKKLIGDEDERAVSPVIGVILMVAITVILAAVIAAFVLDLGGSVGQEAQAGVTMEFDEEEEEVSIEVTSLGNSDHVTFGGIADEFDQEPGSFEFTDSEGTSSGVDNLSTHQMVVGDAVTLDDSHVGSTPAEGTITAVAVIEEDDTATQVNSIEVNVT